MISALAPKTAGSSNVFNDSGTVWKSAVPTVLPSVSCLKRMAKAYVMMASAWIHSILDAVSATS